MAGRSEVEAWSAAPPGVTLPLQAVHIWRVDLDRPPDALDRLSAVLDPAEQARAARFVQPRDRRRYSAARGALRWLLGGYIGQAPTEVQLDYGRHGKPYLIQAETDVRFNVAHSHETALIGVTVGVEIGVDIEHRRAVPELESIARHHFAPGEMARLLAAPPAARQAAFLRLWTRKEAFIKAVGEGLSYPLRTFEVSLETDGVANLVQVGDDAKEADAWSLIHLEPAPGYVGAAAWRQRGREVSLWRFETLEPWRCFERV